MKNRSARMLLCDAHSCIDFSRRLTPRPLRVRAHPQAVQQIHTPMWGAEGRWVKTEPQVTIPSRNPLCKVHAETFHRQLSATPIPPPKPPRDNPMPVILILIALAALWLGLHLMLTPPPKTEIKRSSLHTTTHVDPP